MLPKPDLYSTVLFTSSLLLDRVRDKHLLRLDKHMILEKRKATTNYRPSFLNQLNSEAYLKVCIFIFENANQGPFSGLEVNILESTYIMYLPTIDLASIKKNIINPQTKQVNKQNP